MLPVHYGAVFVNLLLLVSESTQSPLFKRSAPAASGCGIAPNTKKHQSFQSNGGLRHFLVDLPKSYDQNKPSAMIISYHGHGSSNENQESIDQFKTDAFNSDLQAIIVYPNGLPGTDGESAWEGAVYAQPGVSDVSFTADLLNYMRSGYCIDNSRIYAAGKSNGGGFVDVLACSSVGAEFAAFGMSNAALYNEVLGPACSPGRVPSPVIELHGAADTLIDYIGGGSHDIALPSIPDWLKTWATRNGCSTTPVVTKTNGLTHTTYDCNGKINVEGYLVDGMAHTWPDAGNNDSGFQGTKAIVDFFKAHTK